MLTTVTITEEDKPEIERVLAIMDELVRQAGPLYVYEKFIKVDSGYAPESCWYLDNDGNPSCIIGHILKELGWSMEDIAELEKSTPASAITNSTRTSPLWKRLRPNTLRILSAVQAAQDSYSPTTWAEAVQRGHHYYHELLNK